MTPFSDNKACIQTNRKVLLDHLFLSMTRSSKKGMATLLVRSYG
jgi:hypothetical protein